MSLMPPTAPNKSLFFSKNDPLDPRLGDRVQAISDLATFKGDCVILGYTDDEGIFNNGGRPGAQAGPDKIREFFYKLTEKSGPTPKVLGDFGNLGVATGAISPISLQQRHETALQWVEQTHQQKIKMITLGGGHDYGFPDGAGFLNHFLKGPHKPLILNFDAHLDVRPLKNNVINSGTPFYRLLETYPQKFDFVEIGIQNQCNSQTHRDYVNSKNGKIIGLDEILEKGLWTCLESTLKPYFDSQRPTFLSMDIDAFSSSEAPGCSQSWASGLRANEVLPVVDKLCQRLNIAHLGIYEVCPMLDNDNHTSKLAALLMHRYLFAV